MSDEAGRPTTTRTSYDVVAAAYAGQVADELAGKPLDRALLGAVIELSDDGIIADIGCGPGQVTAYLAQNGGRAIGVDLSAAMCALAGEATSLPFGAGDMTALPLQSSSLTAVVSLYAVIHLDADERAAAYREFARVLRPGGHALIAFHTGDQELQPGGQRTMTEWFGQFVTLTFRFLDPAAEADALLQAGLPVVARVDRQHYPAIEYPSTRTYLLVRRPAEA